jgi:hypothetical protein
MVQVTTAFNFISLLGTNPQLQGALRQSVICLLAVSLREAAF